MTTPEPYTGPLKPYPRLSYNEWLRQYGPMELPPRNVQYQLREYRKYIAYMNGHLKYKSVQEPRYDDRMTEREQAVHARWVKLRADKERWSLKKPFIEAIEEPKPTSLLSILGTYGAVFVLAYAISRQNAPTVRNQIPVDPDVPLDTLLADNFDHDDTYQTQIYGHHTTLNRLAGSGELHGNGLQIEFQAQDYYNPRGANIAWDFDAPQLQFLYISIATNRGYGMSDPTISLYLSCPIPTGFARAGFHFYPTDLTEPTRILTNNGWEILERFHMAAVQWGSWTHIRLLLDLLTLRYLDLELLGNKIPVSNYSLERLHGTQPNHGTFSLNFHMERSDAQIIRLDNLYIYDIGETLSPLSTMPYPDQLPANKTKGTPDGEPKPPKGVYIQWPEKFPNGP